MTDIVERLRDCDLELLNEAADEIERLRAALDFQIEQRNGLVTQVAEWQVIAEGLRAHQAALGAALQGGITERDQLKDEIERLQTAISLSAGT